MMQLCDVCGMLCPAEGMLQMGNADGETVFCRHCASIAFPGLVQRLRDACPICSSEAHHHDVNMN